MFSLALPPFDLAPVAWAALVPLALVVQTRSTTPALAAAWATGLILVTSVSHGVHGYAPGVFVIALPLIAVAWFVPPVVITHVASRSARTRTLVFPVAWAGTEAANQELLALPTDLGVSQALFPLAAQSASLVGSLGVTFLLVLTSSLFARSLNRLQRGAIGQAGGWAAAGASVALLNVLMGVLLMPSSTNHARAGRATIVQPAISFGAAERSWADPALRGVVRAHFHQQIEVAAATPGELLVWPEGGGAFESFRVGPAAEELHRLARRSDKHLLVSAVDFDEAGRRYNSVFSFDPRRAVPGKYDKILPVMLAESDTQAGTRPGLVGTRLGAAGLLICYESTLPRYARTLVRAGADFLVVSTSDAAFRVSNLPALHLSTAVMRAIESRRSVIYASNTGPSAVIDASGHIRGQTSLLSSEILSVAFSTEGRHSVFSRVGALVPVAFMVAAGLLVVGGMMRRQRVPRRCWLRAAPVETAIPFLVSVALALGTVPVSLWAVVRDNPHVPPLGEVLRDVWRRPAAAAPGMRQPGERHCGPTALVYLASYYGVRVRSITPTELGSVGADGVSVGDLMRMAARLGLEADAVHVAPTALTDLTLPVIAHLDPPHFVVLLALSGDRVTLFDPSAGLVHVERRSFDRTFTGKVIRVRPPPRQFALAES